MAKMLMENMGPMERASRLVLAAVMVGAVKIWPETTPTWLALLSAYPFLTALVSWDPFYAMYMRFTRGVENIKVSQRRKAAA